MSEKLCAYCKTNPATNRYAKSTGDGSTAEYYCLACYRKVRAQAEKELPAPTISPKKGATQCPNCGCTVQQFKKTNLVGCEHCYKALSWAIEPMIERMQGKSQHCGKEQKLTNRELLIRRYHAVNVIYNSISNETEAEPYEEELKRLQTLLSKNKESI